MCFSATASFAAAGGLALIGAATLAERPAGRMAALAFTPLIFAAHQALEGAIWLKAGSEGPPQALVKAWVFIAEVLWPTYTPLAVLILTRGRRRRQAIAALLIVGIVVSAYFLNLLAKSDFTVNVLRGNLQYAPDEDASHSLSGLYLLATVAPLLLARERFVLAFGLAVLAGAVVTEVFFWHAGPSVWCFFAAIASTFAYLAVREEKRSRRYRLATSSGL